MPRVKWYLRKELRERSRQGIVFTVAMAKFGMLVGIESRTAYVSMIRRVIE